MDPRRKHAILLREMARFPGVDLTGESLPGIPKGHARIREEWVSNYSQSNHIVRSQIGGREVTLVELGR